MLQTAPAYQDQSLHQELAIFANPRLVYGSLQLDNHYKKTKKSLPFCKNLNAITQPPPKKIFVNSQHNSK